MLGVLFTAAVLVEVVEGVGDGQPVLARLGQDPTQLLLHTTAFINHRHRPTALQTPRGTRLIPDTTCA